MLLVALMASSQTKIAPKMKKGLKKTYATEVVTKSPAQKSPITITTQTTYEVTDVTADGYVLDVQVTDVKSDADQNDMQGRIMSMSTEMLKGIHTIYATDKDGKVIKILNFSEIKEKTLAMLDNLLASIPLPDSDAAKSVMGKVTESVKEELINKLTEETVVESVHANTSPLALNGKTIATGTEEEFKNNMGIKMKRTYTVNNKKNIQSSAVMNMSAEEMKEMIYNLVAKMMPDMNDVIRKGMESMMGNIKMEANEETTYTLKSDGWVDTITSEVTSSSMGQSSSVVSKVWLVK
jgi:DNA-binding Lrp family transcriptional regulator